MLLLLPNSEGLYGQEAVPATQRRETAPRKKRAGADRAVGSAEGAAGPRGACKNPSRPVPGSSSPLHSGAGLFQTPFTLSVVVQKIEASPTSEKGLSPLLAVWHQ